MYCMGVHPAVRHVELRGRWKGANAQFCALKMMVLKKIKKVIIPFLDEKCFNLNELKIVQRLFQ